jgi:hypothetical protein
MITWTRTATEAICGGCGAHIAKDIPIQAITLPNVKRIKVRCEQCAGERAPADMPAKAELPHLQLTAFDDDGIERPVLTMTPIRQLAGLPLYWKQKASGE